MNPFSLAGKHIVISGASSGIGRQCAISCAAMGAKLSLLGRNLERLNQTMNSLEGAGHLLYQIDLSIDQDVKTAVENRRERSVL
jgi:short-subunit dehydrogenase